MKKIIFGIIACLCLTMASCGKSGSNIDIKALNDKAENNRSALTQQDYSDMITYLDEIVSSKDMEAMNSEDAVNAMMAVGCAAVNDDDIDNGYPTLDAKNKAAFEKLTKKFQELIAKMAQ